MKIYAVRMGDYVEFRYAKRPPRRKTTKLTQRTSWGWLVLRNTFYLGGRVLGAVRYAKYQRWSRAPKFGRKGRVEIPFSYRAVTTYLDRGL